MAFQTNFLNTALPNIGATLPVASPPDEQFYRYAAGLGSILPSLATLGQSGSVPQSLLTSLKGSTDIPEDIIKFFAKTPATLFENIGKYKEFAKKPIPTVGDVRDEYANNTLPSGQSAEIPGQNQISSGGDINFSSDNSINPVNGAVNHNIQFTPGSLQGGQQGAQPTDYRSFYGLPIEQEAQKPERLPKPTNWQESWSQLKDPNAWGQAANEIGQDFNAWQPAGPTHPTLNTAAKGATLGAGLSLGIGEIAGLARAAAPIAGAAARGIGGMIPRQAIGPAAQAVGKYGGTRDLLTAGSGKIDYRQLLGNIGRAVSHPATIVGTGAATPIVGKMFAPRQSTEADALRAVAQQNSPEGVARREKMMQGALEATQKDIESGALGERVQPEVSGVSPTATPGQDILENTDIGMIKALEVAASELEAAGPQFKGEAEALRQKAIDVKRTHLSTFAEKEKANKDYDLALSIRNREKALNAATKPKASDLKTIKDQLADTKAYPNVSLLFSRVELEEWAKAISEGKRDFPAFAKLFAKRDGIEKSKKKNK